ncbi:MAG: heme-dependent oxidative N-demethylase subunit alpha family protein [Opitutaceae bacterium]
MSELERLFPDEDFRHHLTLRRGDPREFLRNRDTAGRVLAERRKWLGADRGCYARLEPAGEAPWRELGERAVEWGVATVPSGDAVLPAALGGLLEPDLLVLTRDETGVWRLRGGALCFPTSWALEDKLGRSLEAIHGPVPGLNAALGPSINQVLGHLSSDTTIERWNWGLAATDELNLHPSRRLPASLPPVDLACLWLRLEHQALIALPRSGGVMFGIRISLHRLDGLAGTGPGRGLARALRSMPAAMAEYKRVEAVRLEVAAALA